MLLVPVLVSLPLDVAIGPRAAVRAGNVADPAIAGVTAAAVGVAIGSAAPRAPRNRHDRRVFAH